MLSKELDALIVPSNDPHFSEYIANRWACREYISSFNGSAGTVIITKDKALLWTDSRYFLQAERQLDEGWILQKIAIPGTPSIEAWLIDNLAEGSTVGVDGKLYSVAAFEATQKAISPMSIVDCGDIFEYTWTDRPVLPADVAFRLPDSITGESTTSKVKRLRKYLSEIKFNGVYFISALDDIAWLMNMRGNDIEFNPLVVAYAVVEPDCIRVFMDNSRLSDKDRLDMESEGCVFHPYGDFELWLPKCAGRNVMLNKSRFDYHHTRILLNSGAIIDYEPDIFGRVNYMKGLKNKVESEGFRKAMLYDGLALTRFYIWLEKELTKSSVITEMDIVRKLCDFRAEYADFRGPSFYSIVGYKGNGAIVHYHPDEKTAAQIHPDGFLLIDSGGQYITGTTDITRTIHLSEPSEQEKTDYTLVLRGVIDLSMAVFPENLMGLHLDMLARQPLLSHGINYLHGTGHGVGHYLNVHEGPHTVRMNANTVPLEPGMTLSNEPAMYRTGLYGIRNENMMIVTTDRENEFGRFLKFETLTLCFIDTKPVRTELMAQWHINWLNEYHKWVYSSLAPHLKSSEREWLKIKTKPV